MLAAQDVAAGLAEPRRVAVVDGVRLSYYLAGDGLPLVLLHGDGASALDWSWVVPTLSRRYQVYTLDLPGHGDSDKPAASYTPAYLEKIVVGFLDALDLARVALFGSSIGGLIALRAALHRPGRLLALGLVDSGGLGKAISPALTATLLPGVGELLIAWNKTPLGASQRAFSRALMMFARPDRAPSGWLQDQRRLAQTPGCLEAALAAARQAADVFGQREVYREELSGLQLPTALVWGEQDRVVPARHARESVARLRDGHLFLIPDCGHLPHVERPDQFVAAVDRLLSRIRV
ncbi:MAG: alpha/beta fold hydrolase [Chloroflexi bacterium]|nr:alpha/beta fold hydrolase [Chloroflexota bacterium]